MLGAAHACANPLTARFGITHGVAVSLMLPHVVRFNGPVAGEHYAELLGTTHGQIADPATTLANRLEELHAAGGLASNLHSFDIPKSHLPELARDASKEWTAGFNPRPVDEEELLALYEAAY